MYLFTAVFINTDLLISRIEILNIMANAIMICMVKEYILMWNWFPLTNLRLLVEGLEPGLILYTSNLLANFNFVRPPVKFDGTKSSLDVGLAMWTISFFLSVEPTGGALLVSK